MTKAEQLEERTHHFAAQVIEFCRTLPRTLDADVVGRQLLKAATSVAGNYRAVRHARSRAEFVAKMGTVLEEADESIGWLKLMTATHIGSEGRTQELLSEARELAAIFAASCQTARANSNAQRSQRRVRG